MRRLLMLTIATLTIGMMTLATISWSLAPKAIGVPRAPDPADHQDAVVQVYGADVWGIRGRFAIHTWIVTKTAGADHYQKYQVIGWRQRRGQSVVSISRGDPDGDWFGSAPILLLEHRGEAAAQMIPAIHEAALAYPYADEYVMWPGPNSNSFMAWIGLEVPQLGLSLPAKAIGKSWMTDNYPSLERL